MTIKNSLKRFLADESGASLAEYALLLGVIVVGVVAAIGTFRGKIETAMTNAGNAID